MIDMDKIATAFLHRFDPEPAHELAITAMALGLTPKAPKDDPALAVECLGLRFPNPIGLAAGFDKNARAARPLTRMGFGHVEVGTVTPRPQPGNPQPRLFRLPEDGAIINRMGFNGCGIDRFCRNLARLHRPQPNGRRRGPIAPLGANLGINKTGSDPLRDYPELVARVRPYADYVTINLSSPNTPGLRDLQSADILAKLLAAIATRNPERPPLLVKLAPDMSDDAYEPVLNAALQGGAQGLILTNTTIARPEGLSSPHAHESGGLSGRPLAPRARDVLRHVAQLNKGRLTLISAGGIESGRDVLDRIRLGASMVQLYTSFILEGASLLPRIKAELLNSMREDGIASLHDAHGLDLT
ncbi:quinone-dependent dihydroorotate dehydrogenase [Neokomagataea anthophila]|uniref:Dihydroorotate dehydrogenase (quinone) n=1 Tax=Neokomagataea anthophila TaxID=2826925 RepID=A0ABS5E7H5_9PROT|nr:quinone-dependent dihydroorotate dehydrogenase [Neokomagataea anthophila]MBR0559858.1 quinone-dependent dihydroorotate dehydrogenase [Neokomagataea anthophila]